MTGETHDPLMRMFDTAWATAKLAGKMTEAWTEVWWAAYTHWVAAAGGQMHAAHRQCGAAAGEPCEGPLFA